MKTIISKIAAVATIFISTEALSQGFLNLNFEAANPSGFSPGAGNLQTSVALPGWTAYYSTSTTTNQANAIWYDTVSLGGAFIALCDTNANSLGPPPIQGTYSVLLQGSSASTPTSAAIGQTGTISASVQSLTFFGVGGNFQVTFNGQPISYLITGSTANYSIYGADISGYAGQTGELRFTGLSPSYALIDNIQFSTSPVPEPSTFALAALGGALLGFRRWTKPS